MKIRIKGNSIRYRLTRSEVETLCDKVGFQHLYRTQSGTELSLLVEKDFACMDETVDDQSDNYPNPKANN